MCVVYRARFERMRWLPEFSERAFCIARIGLLEHFARQNSALRDMLTGKILPLQGVLVNKFSLVGCVGRCGVRMRGHDVRQIG
jgi:hypothetical protein